MIQRFHDGRRFLPAIGSHRSKSSQLERIPKWKYALEESPFPQTHRNPRGKLIEQPNYAAYRSLRQ